MLVLATAGAALDRCDRVRWRRGVHAAVISHSFCCSCSICCCGASVAGVARRGAGVGAPVVAWETLLECFDGDRRLEVGIWWSCAVRRDVVVKGEGIVVVVVGKLGMCVVEGLLEFKGFSRVGGVLESSCFVLDPYLSVHVLGESGDVLARVGVLKEV